MPKGCLAPAPATSRKNAISLTPDHDPQRTSSLTSTVAFPDIRAIISYMTVLKTKYALWAADWQRAVAFYRDLFGGTVTMESEVWSEVHVANGIIGIHGGGEGKRTWTGLSFQVEDLRSAIEELKAHGGSLTREPHDTPEDPLHLAMCIDPDGNEFMMTQPRH